MGAPASSIFSELYLQYIEHTALYDILIHNCILGYFRYVDDILLIYDIEKTDIHTVLNSFNNATANLKFTIEEEEENRINFLDITITRGKHCFVYDIYRKPTATDIIIPRESCHPHEHKLSAIRYLRNRHETYPIAEQNKQKEKDIIEHVLRNNNYSPTTLNTRTHRNVGQDEHPQQQKWAKFTYQGTETRFVTKLFQKAGLKIAYTTRHTTGQLLTHNNGNRCNKYEGNGVYQLACLDCNRHYVGQTGRSFRTRYKEHARDYQDGTQKSQYAKHLFDNQHALHPMDTSMTILTTPYGHQYDNPP
jgi:hypothetical protein